MPRSPRFQASRFVTLTLLLLAQQASAMLAAPSQSAAITRDAAIAIVTTSIIDTSSVKESLHAYALQATIPAGTAIAQNTIDDLAAAPAEGWFFWLDMNPVSRFAHDTKFVLVRDSDGAIVLVIDAEWWPSVGGIDYYATDFDRDNSLDLFWLAGAPYPLASGSTERARDAAPTTADWDESALDLLRRQIESDGPGLAGTWGIIICPYDTSKDAAMAADVRCAITTFAALGAGKSEPLAAPVVINKTKQQTCDAINALPDECSKLYVFWVGHGRPDSLCFPGGSAMTAHEFACKLKDQKAAEYCVIVDACYSGSLLDDLADKGVNGFHMMSSNATTPALFFGSAHWTGSFVGGWFSHYAWECIAGGRTGTQAFAWADSAVKALKDSVKAGADSTKWKPFLGGSNPTGGYVHVFGGGGAGASGGGEPFCFSVAQGCSTVCINIPGGTASDTCGNFTISCQTATGPDTTWQKAGTHNWTKGRTIYLRTYGLPGATGMYKIAMHSNKGGVRSLITWLADTSVPVTVTTVSGFNAHSVGWIDGLGSEFNTLLGAGTNGSWFYQWNDGVVFNQIPANTGPNWFTNVQVVLPLQADPSRPQLYQGGDPLQGYAENTILLFIASRLMSPGGGPGFNAQFQAQAFQETPGFIDQFFGTFQSPPGARGGSLVPEGLMLAWNMGTIFPEPLLIQMMVPGPDVVVWDAVVLLPESAVGTGIPITPSTPMTARLYPNAPNPVVDGTTIRFDLAVPGKARVSIYDVSGRLVRTLLEESRPRGFNSAFWDARSEDGNRMASGVYVYRLEAPGVVESRRLVLIK